MKRSGFTMIELIFVIVILGILAAVAIPKLAATRDDARIARGATEVAQVLADMGARFTARGTLVGDTIADVTNVNSWTVANTTALATGAGGAITYADDNNNSCVIFTLNNNLIDGNVSVSAGTNTGAICTGIRAAVADIISSSPHEFGGSQVVW